MGSEMCIRDSPRACGTLVSTLFLSRSARSTYLDMLGKVVELSEVCLHSVDTSHNQTGLTIGARLGAPDSNEENQYSALRRLKIFLRAREKKKNSLSDQRRRWLACT